MPSNSDICNGGMTTGLLDKSNTSFSLSKPDAAALTSQNTMKIDLESEDPGDTNAEFQESGSLLTPFTGEIPAYSILLYRQGTPPEQEGLNQFMSQATSRSLNPTSSQSLNPSSSQLLNPSSSQSLNPYSSQSLNPSSSQSLNPSSSQSLNPIGTPFKVQSFLLAQGQTQAQSFHSSYLCPPKTCSSQNTNNMIINPQQMDPVWLQILSNILAKPLDNKGENNSLISDVYSEGCHVPKASMPQIQGGAIEIKNSCETYGAEPKLKVQLAKTSSRQPSQIKKSLSLNVPKAQFVLLSPMSNSPNFQVRSLPPTVHQATTNLSFPTLNNKLNPVTSHYVNLNSSGEESQQPSPLKSDHDLGKDSLHNCLDATKLTEYSIPLLPSSPILEHDVGGGPMRESHNMKERRRRARIKDACNLMRQLVPGMSKKTDKATVFEFSARYIHFLKSFVGANNDKEFLVKYNPY